jgi:cobalt-zinc-cadmium efflux system protein
MADNIAISAGRRNKKKLWIVFSLTAGYMVAEALGGLLTGSLALLADAGHMLTDAGALGLALFAIRYAERAATPAKTYGYLRTEILAALANAVALLLISFFILYEAWQRIRQPPEVLAGPMLLVASLGLILNFVSMRMLTAAAGESLNAKGAYLEVLSDTLGSIGVIAASVIVLTTRWYFADPIIGAAIGLFIVPRTWTLLKDATHILMEGVPERIDVLALESAMLGVAGVVAVHDLHVWTLTSGWDSLSAHVTIEDGTQQGHILTDLQKLLKQTFEIEHATLQLEKKGAAPPESLSI